MRLFPAVFLLFAAPAVASAEVRVTLQDGRLDVSARAPLSEILDRIARQTGMKVVYDGAPPRQVVAADYRALPPARAVIGLLEGQNLNFAAITDKTGEKITTLMVLGSGARPGVAAAAPPPPPVPISTGFDESDAEINNGEMFDEAAPAEEEPEPEVEPAPEPEEDPKQGRPDAAPALIPQGGVWTQPQVQGQQGVFSPFPPPPQPAPPDEKPAEPETE